MHVNIAPYHVSVLLLCLTVKGPNMSSSQWVNGAASFDLQAGRFAIFCSPNLPLNLWHSTQLEITIFTAELAPIIQYPALRISLKVNHHWYENLQSALIWESYNLPQTWITSDSSRNKCSWDILQFSFNLLESLSFPSTNFNHLYSSLKCFCCTNFTNDIRDSWIMLVAISVVVTSTDVIIFLCFILVF